MVGHEDEDRIAEPLLVAEAVEESAERLVDVGHALVVGREPLGEPPRVTFGYDEGVVRRESEHRREEWLPRL